MKGVWPSWVTQSSLSPVHEPIPSSTAKTGGEPSVHCLHRARMADSLVGSKFTMTGLILRPLIPPASLMSLTKVWMAAFCAPNSVSPAKPKFDARLVRFDTGKATVIELAVTPRVLVDAWSTVTPLGLPSPSPLLLAPPLPVAPLVVPDPTVFFGDVPATANTT